MTISLTYHHIFCLILLGKLKVSHKKPNEIGIFFLILVSSPAKIAFRVDSVNKDFDHFVLLDNFELEGGDLCGDLAAKSENRLMDQFLPVCFLQ